MKIKVGKFSYNVELKIEKTCWLDDESELYEKARTFSKDEIKELHIKSNLTSLEASRLDRYIENAKKGRLFIKVSSDNKIDLIAFDTELEFAIYLGNIMLDSWDKLIKSDNFKGHLDGYVLASEKETADFITNGEKALKSFEKRVANAYKKAPDKFYIRGYWANR